MWCLGVREPRAKPEIGVELSPPPPPRAASRPRPRPAARLPHRPGSGEPLGPSRGSHGQHQLPLRELLRLHHAGAGHRDRGASPTLWGLRVSIGAPREGTQIPSLWVSQLCLSCCVPQGPGFEVLSLLGAWDVPCRIKETLFISWNLWCTVVLACLAGTRTCFHSSP